MTKITYFFSIDDEIWNKKAIVVNDSAIGISLS